MTEKQFLKKVDELIERNDEYIKRRAKSFLKSGGVDLDEWDDNYALPKLFMCVVSGVMKEQWAPLSPHFEGDLKNIEKFV